jgi:hypothetical protein
MVVGVLLIVLGVLVMLFALLLALVNSAASSASMTPLTVGEFESALVAGCLGILMIGCGTYICRSVRKARAGAAGSDTFLRHV